MAIRVGINGFGRIGRQVLKAIRDYYPEELVVVAFVVNDFLSERDATRSRRPTRWNVLEEKMAVNQHRV